MSRVWRFLKDRENRRILAWVGGGITAGASAIVGLWVAISAPDPPPSPSTEIRANGGVASGRDVNVGGDIRIEGGDRRP